MGEVAIKTHSSISIAQITDSHIMPPGKWWKDNPEAKTAQRLSCVIDHINKLNPRPDLVIHTADITDGGDLESYRYAKTLLDMLEIPYCLACGNHDNFENMKQVFTHHTYFMDPHFAHYVIDSLPVRIIVLDTTVEGEIFGRLCNARIEWLARALHVSQQDTLIFMHHFPIAVQDVFFNQINLLDSTKLEAIVERNPHVLGLYCGHYHYSAVRLFGGKICFIAPSTAPAHILRGSTCIGLDFVSPSYTLHRYVHGMVTSQIIPVELN